jgi:Fe-S cluster assembly protein SufD
VRREAKAAFDAVGLPAPGNEDWRQTNVQGLASIPFVAAPPAELDAEALAAGPRVVLVNGRVAKLDGLPEGVTVLSLARALAEIPETIEPHLGRVAPTTGHPFAALNTALFEDGVLVSIPAGAQIGPAIQIVHASVADAGPAAVLPRVLIVAGPRSSATVVEMFVSKGGTTLTSAVTEIVVLEGARVDHVKLQAESEDAWHIAAIAGRVARDGRLASHNVSWGAKLARNDIGAVLDGEGASCHLYGLYLADGSQHVDNHTWLDHAKPHCPSWEMYKGILAGSARAVFNGRIIVRQDAQKTDAKQSNKNLILSDGAVVYTRPQLEIYANDVRCTHGATIGRLDEAAVFYLRSRGLGAVQARDLLVHAFADDVLAKIPDQPTRAAAGRALYARLARDLET